MFLGCVGWFRFFACSAFYVFHFSVSGFFVTFWLVLFFNVSVWYFASRFLCLVALLGTVLVLVIFRVCCFSKDHHEAHPAVPDKEPPTSQPGADKVRNEFCAEERQRQSIFKAGVTVRPIQPDQGGRIF